MRITQYLFKQSAMALVGLAVCSVLTVSVNASVVDHKYKADFFHEPNMPGLPASIRGIVRDTKGFLWYAMADGLLRYDGRNFKKILSRPDEAIHKKDINRLYLIGDQLWLGYHLGGVGKLNTNSLTYKEYGETEGLKGRSVTKLRGNSDGSLWVSTDEGLNLYDIELDRFISYEVDFDNNKGASYSRGAILDGNGLAWAINKKHGLLYVDTKSRMSHRVKNHNVYQLTDDLLSKLGPGAENIYKSKMGRIYIAVRTGVLIFDDRGQLLKDISYKKNIVDERLNTMDIYEGNRGDVYISTTGSVIVKVGGDLSHLEYINTSKSKSGFMPKYVTDIIVEENNSLIVSYYVGSLRYWNSVQEHLSKKDLSSVDPALSDFHVQHYLTTNSGDYYVSDKGEIVLISPAGEEKFFLKTNDSYFAVVYAWDRLILSNTMGVFTVDKTGRIEQIYKGYVTSLCYSKKHGVFWYSIDSIKHLEKFGQEIKSYSMERSQGQYNSNMRASDENVWYLTAGESYYYEQGKFKSLKQDKEHKLIGKLDIAGNYLIDLSDKIKIFNVRRGDQLFLEFKLSINTNIDISNTTSLCDENACWIKDESSGSLSYLNMKTWQFKTLDPILGYPKDKWYRMVAVVEGKVLLKRAGALSWLNMSTYSPPQPYKPALLHYTIADKNGQYRDFFGLQEDVAFKNNDSFIRFYFGDLQPKKQSIPVAEYRLLGHDNSWYKSQDNTAAYSALNAGDYEFQIRSPHSGLILDKIKMTVEPTWWQSQTAYAAYTVLLFIVIAIPVYQYRQKLQTRRLNAAELKYMATIDKLTGVANRYALERETDKRAAKASSSKHQFSMLFIDVDRFKSINDAKTHQFGDILLCAITKRIHSVLFHSDFLARIGGDEFVVLAAWGENPNKGESLAKKIIKAMELPLFIQGKELYATVSIGVADSGKNDSLVEDMLRNSDLAMYKAKQNVGNSYALFDAKLIEDAQRTVELEANIRLACKLEQFQTYLQPKVDLQTGIVTGFEALVRWIKDGKLVTGPDEFIPLAESIGIIADIGELVLNQTCKFQLKQIKRGLYTLPIAINVSSYELTNTNYFATVEKAIQACNIPRQLIEFEITESMVINNRDVAIDQLNQLRNGGHKIYMDDFGTGYSSLSYLQYLPIDVLKIDRAFIIAVDKDRGQQNMVRGIIDLARNLGLDIVTEGVEKIEEHAHLSKITTGSGQGYLYSRPLSQDDELITKILSSKEYLLVKPEPTTSLPISDQLRAAKQLV